MSKHRAPNLESLNRMCNEGSTRGERDAAKAAWQRVTGERWSQASARRHVGSQSYTGQARPRQQRQTQQEPPKREPEGRSWRRKKATREKSRAQKRKDAREWARRKAAEQAYGPDDVDGRNTGGYGTRRAYTPKEDYTWCDAASMEGFDGW